MLNVFVSFGSFILISQYLQLVLGLSPLQAGLLSLPASLLAIAGPMLSPVLVQRVGTPLALAGLLATAAVGFGLLTLVGGPLAAFTVAVGWTLWALGGSAAATLSTGTIIGAARPERAGAVSAAARDTLGGALSVASQLPDSAAAASLVLTAQDALTTALHATSAIGAVISIVTAVAVAIYLRDGQPQCDEPSGYPCEPEPARAV